MTECTSASHAVAEAWASIDGKLDEFRSGRAAGYWDDADALVMRVERRGYRIVPTVTLGTVAGQIARCALSAVMAAGVFYVLVRVLP